MGLPSLGFRKKVAAIVHAEKVEEERLRREDHLRVKHDKLFSDWKILVGPSHWKNHAAGEDGSQRYNIHNLPAAYFGPGVYELGLTRESSLHADETDPRKIRRHAVLVVYLGQADNVRHRLQRYGQTGSHLEDKLPISVPDSEFKRRQAFRSAHKQAEMTGMGHKSGTRESSSESGLHLFTEVFSRGYSIAFRWARTESKQSAETVESELLHVFDYPWNTALNGARRPLDILTKLELLQEQLESSHRLARADSGGVGWKRREYLTRTVGISVSVRKPEEELEASSHRARTKLSIFFTSITAPKESGDGTNHTTSVCGVLLEDEDSCSSPAVQGRRRCTAHKGRRVQVSKRLSRSRTAKVSFSPVGKPVAGRLSRSKTKVKIGQVKKPVAVLSRSKTAKVKIGQVKKPVAMVNVTSQVTGKRVEIADVTELVCGAPLETGSFCLNMPVEGRKRCSDHKGIRITTRKLKSKRFPTANSGFSTPRHPPRKRHS